MKICMILYATTVVAVSHCPRIFKDEKYTFVVEKSNIVSQLDELVVISKLSADRVPQWIPVPMPAGIYVQAGTADRARELFISLARSFAAPVPAVVSGSAAVAFHRPSADLSLDEIIAGIADPGLVCGGVDAAVLWDGRVGFLARDCHQLDTCPVKKFPFLSPVCSEEFSEAEVVLEGRGAHRKLHNANPALEWLPRELFVDPDEAPEEATPLAKVDIEAPAYLSPTLPVFVAKYPVKVHARYVQPQSEGGYALTHIENPVNLEISDEKFPTIWDYLADAPQPAVHVPRGYRMKCVSAERNSQVIEIPAGRIEDRETAVRIATVSAISGLLAIAWFARQRSRA